MKDKKLSIVIERPVHDVYEFTLDPKNTPKWIDGIVHEETSEWPCKLGTMYKNQGKDNTWNEYRITELVQDITFTLARINGDYHVRYTFKPKGPNTTEFEYYEWIESGELDNTVSQSVLERLKEAIENEG